MRSKTRAASSLARLSGSSRWREGGQSANALLDLVRRKFPANDDLEVGEVKGRRCSASKTDSGTGGSSWIYG